MKQEGMTASEVSYQTGFSSPAYFNNCFRDFFGYPPGEVKKMRIDSPEENGSMESPEIPGPTTESGKDGGKKPELKKLTGRLLFTAASGLLVVLFCLILATILANADREKSIAILPIKSLSDDPKEQYLADGMMDEILLRLFEIRDRDFHVLSRTSVEQYRATSKTIQTIGKELNVKYIVEGTFQKYEDSVKLRLQLINARTGVHEWGHEYTFKWKNIFTVQSEVALTIASEIGVPVSPEEKIIMESPSTSDLTAYDYFLRGNDFFKHSNEKKEMILAIRMYEKAVKIDPNYTLAWVGLTRCYRFLFWNYNTGSDETLALAGKYLDKALVLSPGLKEVRIEEASYYYQCKRNFSKSIQLLERLKTEYPNDDEVYFWIGAVMSRMGEYGKALENTEFAIRLNPSYWRYVLMAAGILEVLHEYIKAEDYYNQAIDLNPSVENLYDRLLDMYISTGQIQKARVLLAGHEQLMDPQDVKLKKAWLATLERNYDKALQITQLLAEGTDDDELIYTKNLQLGLLYRLVNDNTTARRYFEVERDILLKKIKESVYDFHLYAKLGTAYAGLGMKEPALEAGRKALELLNSSNDAMIGCWREMNMVRILIMVGEYDEALVKLDQIIKNPGFYTVEILKLDPFWYPVRNHEKFKEIISNPEYQINLSIK
jgi:TolB-like protein/Flp pilus assembly protein TadD